MISSFFPIYITTAKKPHAISISLSEKGKYLESRSLDREGNRKLLELCLLWSWSCHFTFKKIQYLVQNKSNHIFSRQSCKKNPNPPPKKHVALCMYCNFLRKSSWSNVLQLLCQLPHCTQMVLLPSIRIPDVCPALSSFELVGKTLFNSTPNTLLQIDRV